MRQKKKKKMLRTKNTELYNIMQNNVNMVSLSSVAPTKDGRRKPGHQKSAECRKL
jgi:hypothetical protein